MESTVATAAAEKYRTNLTVIPGGKGLPIRGRRMGRRTRTAAELVLDNRMHTAFVQLRGSDDTVPSMGIEDIRRRRQHPWRVMARRIVEAHAAGVPLPAALEVVHTFGAWVEQLYQTNGETVTERVTLFQSPVRLTA